MSEQQSLKCVLPAHQAQTGARFSKYFISQGGTKEKQPDSQWELNITLMLRTYEKKWPSSGQKKILLQAKYDFAGIPVPTTKK